MVFWTLTLQSNVIINPLHYPFQNLWCTTMLSISSISVTVMGFWTLSPCGICCAFPSSPDSPYSIIVILTEVAAWAEAKGQLSAIAPPQCPWSHRAQSDGGPKYVQVDQIFLIYYMYYYTITPGKLWLTRWGQHSSNNLWILQLSCKNAIQFWISRSSI